MPRVKPTIEWITLNKSQNSESNQKEIEPNVTKQQQPENDITNQRNQPKIKTVNLETDLLQENTKKDESFNVYKYIQDKMATNSIEYSKSTKQIQPQTYDDNFERN